MLVYRDCRRRFPAGDVLRHMAAALGELRLQATEETILGALLQAGELECALCDIDSHSHNAEVAATLTDQLATIACRIDVDRGTSHAGVLIQTCQQLLNSIRYDGELTISRPEGFSYYALHPLDFADLVSAAGFAAPCAHVVGIRSIGTTLSAVVATKLNADRISASRITVRPEGHPYDRQTAFTCAQRDGIKQALSRGALFLVCDEGPGRSGSSLLSVAQALEEEGVSRECIVLLCSHQPNPDELCAPRGPERWRRSRSLAVGMTKRLPQQADRYIGGGEWRKFFIPEAELWPASWPQMERLKFLSRDGKRLFKFEGHGRYGEPVRRCEQLRPVDSAHATWDTKQASGCERVAGHHASLAKASRPPLRHLAQYCAWRAAALPATVAEVDIGRLEHMAAYNVEQEFGFAPKVRLEVERPAICDGRMQHYKWRELGNDHWIKLDASTHGDDHFFPGPTDIAWDLAGVCVEWQLNADCREFLLSEYRRVSGDNLAARVQPYEIAYAAFRLGWSRMAASSVSGTDDEDRLLRDTFRYRTVLNRIVTGNSPAH